MKHLPDDLNRALGSASMRAVWIATAVAFVLCAGGSAALIIGLLLTAGVLR